MCAFLKRGYVKFKKKKKKKKYVLILKQTRIFAQTNVNDLRIINNKKILIW